MYLTQFNIYKNDLPGELLEDRRFSETINDTPYVGEVAFFFTVKRGFTKNTNTRI